MPRLRENATRKAASAAKRAQKTGRSRKTKQPSEELDAERPSLADLVKLVGSMQQQMNSIQAQMDGRAAGTSQDNRRRSKSSSRRKQADLSPPRKDESDSSSDSGDSSGEEDSSDLDIPSPGRLRHQRKVQQHVRGRLEKSGLLKESAPSSKDKNKGKAKGSGRTRTMHDEVIIHIPWPQYHVQDSLGNPLCYDDLSQSQFMQGFLQIIMDEKDPAMHTILLKHLQDLNVDISKYGFEPVRNFHAILLSRIECGKLTWQNEKEILHIRQRELWSRNPILSSGKSTPDTRARRKSSTFNVQSVACKAFQNGKCKSKGDHATNDQIFKHVCAYCFSTGLAFRHREADCQRKLKHSNSKNSN